MESHLQASREKEKIFTVLLLSIYQGKWMVTEGIWLKVIKVISFDSDRAIFSEHFKWNQLEVHFIIFSVDFVSSPFGNTLYITGMFAPCASRFFASTLEGIMNESGENAGTALLFLTYIL